MNFAWGFTVGWFLRVVLVPRRSRRDDQHAARVRHLESLIVDLKTHEPVPYSPRVERLYQEVGST